MNPSLSLAITDQAEQAGEEERSSWFSGGNKRKDETSRVLVYNSYIYPTLGTTFGFTFVFHLDKTDNLAKISAHFTNIRPCQSV